MQPAAGLWTVFCLHYQPEFKRSRDNSVLMLELLSHRWDPESNRWSFVCPMSVARLGAGVTACGGFLYVVGGYDGQTRWNTAERYQPDTNAWQPLAPMSMDRSGLGES